MASNPYSVDEAMNIPCARRGIFPFNDPALRKIVAFILGFSLVFTLGYITQTPSYLLVADWIGPVVGSSIMTALTVIYILLGDPLKYIGLALIWTFTAFLVDLIVSKIVGAVLKMLARAVQEPHEMEEPGAGQT
jgi:hypothetical protein